MSKQHTLLNWVVDIIDQEFSPTTELIRIQTLLSELRASMVQVSHHTSSPIPEELDAILNDFTHAATYIKATIKLPVDVQLSQYMVPCQMSQAFGSSASVKIEDFVAEHAYQRKQVEENLKARSSINSVDVIQKGSFIQEEKPSPGEVANFVAERELKTPIDEEIYAGMSELKQVFLIPGAESCVIGHNHIDAYNIPESFYIPDIKYYNFNIHATYTADPCKVEYVGYDPDTDELIIVDDGIAYRISRADYAPFILKEVPAYDGRVIRRIAKALKAELADTTDGLAKVEISTYKIGDEYLLVCLKHGDAGYSSFTTSIKTFNKHFGEQVA